jgi:hypothetical protein
MSLVFLNDRAVRSATAFGSLNTGSMVFIKKLTASSSATLSFVDGASSVVLDSTYKEYLFTFNSMHPASAALEYTDANDQAQGTSFQALLHNLGNDADQCCSGYLRLFNPSSTTFVKHFLAASSNTQYQDIEFNHYVGGYFNTTSAIDEIQFKMTSGNIDAGDICLYGIL